MLHKICKKTQDFPVENWLQNLKSVLETFKICTLKYVVPEDV